METAGRADGLGMRARFTTLVLLAFALAGIDLLVNAFVSTASWDYHQRSTTWSVLTLLFLTVLVSLAAVPSRVAAIAAGIVAGGVLGSVMSAHAHAGGVPD